MYEHPIIVIKHPESPQDTYDFLLKSFSNKQYCQGGVDALQLLEQSPAELVIIETETDDMTGLEIAEAIRDIDTEEGHFTFIILIGDIESDILNAAFENTIDVHIPHQRQHTLAQATTSGCRLSKQINTLHAHNETLEKNNLELQKGQLLDPLTGLGNRRFAEQNLTDSIRQIESRGGAVCFLVIAVHNYTETIETYDEKIAEELVVSISEKIQHLIRPMDILTYYGPGQFALVLLQPSIDHCNANCYQRIFDGVRLKSYQTAAGFLPADIAMSLCASHAENGPPSPQVLIESALSNLDAAYKSAAIHVHHLTSKN